jgi:hypothetical protein
MSLNAKRSLANCYQVAYALGEKKNQRFMNEGGGGVSEAMSIL